jgi:hypothetical protein
MMPPRRISQCLHPDKGLPQTPDQNQPLLQQQPTQILPTITEAPEHPTLDSIPEHLLQQINMSTTAVCTTQIDEGTSSTQTNRDDHDINNPPPPANPPPPSQVNQSEANVDQIEVQD